MSNVKINPALDLITFKGKEHSFSIGALIREYAHTHAFGEHVVISVYEHTVCVISAGDYRYLMLADFSDANIDIDNADLDTISAQYQITGRHVARIIVDVVSGATTFKSSRSLD